MYSIILPIVGLMLYFLNGQLALISHSMQQALFLAATLLLGVPHGAADLLVAQNNALQKSVHFSVVRFFGEYLGAIAIFVVAFYLFPLTTNLVFILLASYHFGESDLSSYHIRGHGGTVFSIAYGLLIIGTILLPHWAEVQPIISMIATETQQQQILDVIGQNKYIILAFLSLVVIIVGSYYTILSRSSISTKIMFWVNTLGLILIVAQLPMLLAFTCYFVFWHSLRSIHQIVSYLQRRQYFTLRRILSEMTFYSLLAILGVGLLGICFYGYSDSKSLQMYIFSGLAVLTAPHMRVMHDMHEADIDPDTVKA